MKKTKIEGAIVCDTIGCGNLATVKLTSDRTGTSVLLCDECVKELSDALSKEKESEKKNGKV